MKQACRRHLDDLETSEQFHFDEKAAAKACQFIELMPHVKGKWARERKTLTLEPWQVFITANIFGWLREDGTRRFRVAYLEVPRKNGKSFWAAAVALYMLTSDGEAGAEVFCGATSQKQAFILFDMAQKMARSTPAFRDAFGVTVNASNLAVVSTGSKFEPLIGKPGDGASPSCAIIDEFHEHDSDALIEAMITGMAAREQPLVLITTTAGSDTSGPCYAMRQDVVNMLSGTVENDELFGLIYTIDEGDDWTSDEALEKANPNLAVSVSLDWLKQQIKEALASPRRQAAVKTKHLNLWVNAKSGWLDMEAWNACADPALDINDFASEPCWIGLDLSSKTDVTAAAHLFKRDEIYYLFVDSYLPESKAQDPAARHYQGWAEQGHLILTEGDLVDHEQILADILEASERHRIVRVGADPWNATHMLVRLQQAGIDAVEVPQNVRHLSEPMKWLEGLIGAGKLRHNGNPALTWQMSNVTCKEDPAGNIYPRKERPENKIDGAVASIIALSGSQREEEPDRSESLRIRTI